MAKRFHVKILGEAFQSGYRGGVGRKAAKSGRNRPDTELGVIRIKILRSYCVVSPFVIHQ